MRDSASERSMFHEAQFSNCSAVGIIISTFLVCHQYGADIGTYIGAWQSF